MLSVMNEDKEEIIKILEDLNLVGSFLEKQYKTFFFFNDYEEEVVVIEKLESLSIPFHT